MRADVVKPFQCSLFRETCLDRRCGLIDLRACGVVSFGRVGEGLARRVVTAGQVVDLTAEAFDRLPGIGFRIVELCCAVAGTALLAFHDQKYDYGQNDEYEKNRGHEWLPSRIDPDNSRIRTAGEWSEWTKSEHKKSAPAGPMRIFCGVSLLMEGMTGIEPA